MDQNLFGSFRIHRVTKFFTVKYLLQAILPTWVLYSILLLEIHSSPIILVFRFHCSSPLSLRMLDSGLFCFHLRIYNGSRLIPFHGQTSDICIFPQTQQLVIFSLWLILSTRSINKFLPWGISQSFSSCFYYFFFFNQIYQTCLSGILLKTQPGFSYRAPSQESLPKTGSIPSHPICFFVLLTRN